MSLQKSNQDSPIFLEIKKLFFSLGRNKILNGIDLVLRDKEKIGLIGPSGSGKSVLCKVIAGIYGDFEDEIVWGADEIPTIGFLFQEGALFDSLDVIDNVVFPLRNGKSRQKYASLSKSDARDKAAEVIKQVGLSAALGKQVNELSGGMRKRVGIARALVHEPKLLLLDEPTSGLDPVTANTIMDLIDRLTSIRDCTTIIVSHDLRRLLPRVERAVYLNEGVVISDGHITDLEQHAPEKVLKFIKTRFDFEHESRTQ